MTANKMPEMPFSPYLVSEWNGPSMTDRKMWTAYTADQMHAYAVAYAAALSQPAQVPADESIYQRLADELATRKYDHFPTREAVLSALNFLGSQPAQVGGEACRDRLWDAILGQINLRHVQIADGNTEGSDMETADRIRALMPAALPQPQPVVGVVIPPMGKPGLCGCGRAAEYMTSDGKDWCCNKYGARCATPPPPSDAAQGDEWKILDGYFLHNHAADLDEVRRAYVSVKNAARPVRVDEASAAGYLRDLVDALDKAFISSWQSTESWNKQLTAAREYLAHKGEGNG